MGKLDIFVIMNLLIHELYINLFSLFWYLYILCNILHAAAKSRQSCPTLCDPIDGSPPGSSVPGILQANILEWVAISFSNVGK